MSILIISGTIINFFAVIIASLIGVFVGSRLSNAMNSLLMQSVSLPMIYLGLQNASKLEKIPNSILPGLVLALLSLVIGGLIGEICKIEERLEALGNKIKQKIGAKGSFSQGFVNASLLFCIGPMAILGSIENGLGLGMQTLILKSVLDAITSIVMASIYGIGVGFSAIPILIYQGLISIIAFVFGKFIDSSNSAPILLISGIGGLIILSIGINMLLTGLNIKDRRIKIGSFLPSLVVGPVLYWITGLFT